MRTLTCVSAALLAMACSKKTDNQPPAAKTVAPTADKTKAAEPAKPAAPATVSVTSKSPDAIKVFEQARELADKARAGEAVPLFKKAVELDPDFAQAHAYLGGLTPGAEGMAELDKAKALAASLPEPERLLIEAVHADRSGDHAAWIAALTKVTDLAPGEWRTFLELGNDANQSGDHARAIQLFEKALAVKPDLAIAQNGLAYAHAGQREWDPAIAAAKKQAELLPKEPNPQDSLGEILLMAGKFDDAEKAFQAAVTIEPKFDLAWQGVALARAYRGDWKGAHEANDKRVAGAFDTNERVDAMIDGAWLSFAEDKLPDAIARLEALDKDAEAQKTPRYAFAAFDRAFMLQFAGKYADSTKWLDTGMKRADGLPGAGKHQATRNHAIGLLRIAAMTGKPTPDADKLVAVIDQDATTLGDPGSKTFAAWAHGLAAWAKTGAKDAVAELSKCAPEVLPCRFDLAAAQRKAGDKAGAEATEKQIRETPVRDVGAVYVIDHVAKK